MKKAYGSGSIRKRSDGTWEGRILIDGKSRSVYGKTQTVVRQKLTQIRSELDNDEYIEPSKLTLQAWFEMWQDTYLEDVKGSTADRYKSCIRTHIIPALGKVQLTDLKPSIIQQFLNGCKRKGLAKKSVMNIRLVLHRALEQAVDDEQIKRNPCDKTKVPSYDEPVKEMRPLKDNEVAEFLSRTKGDPYEVMFYVALFTGMRESELIGLTWDCIDFEHGTIRLYRQLKRARGGGEGYVFTTLKNKQSRVFAAAPDVLAVLHKRSLKQKEDRLRAGGVWENADDLVFTNELGRHIATHTLWKHFKSIVSSMGLPEMRFHDLRHSYATLALQNDINVKTVSATLGHATTAFTLDKYGHVSDAMQRDSADKMQRFISSL